MALSKKSASHYYSHIDGLRAIAVLSVVLYHLGISQFSGGFVGVDVFFVISGFLITRLIRDELALTGTFSFSNFYIRRIRRLFPAFALTLILCFIAAPILLSDKLLAQFGESSIYALFSASNFYFWKNTNYFMAESGVMPLLHTWTLSVEEQFYLIWPTLLVVMFKCNKNLKAIPFISACFFVSLLLSVYYIGNQSMIFYLLPFRAFEFCIGATLVWLIHYRINSNILNEGLVLLGLLCVSYPVFYYTNTTSFPAYNALMPCLGAAMLIYAGDSTYSGQLLKNKLMVIVGLISYSLYLIHWPIIVFYKHYQDVEGLNWGAQFFLIIVSMVSAYSMYRYVEQPFRMQRFQLNKVFLKYCAAITVLICTFSVSAHIQNGWEWRTGSKRYPDANYAGEKYSWRQTIGETNHGISMIIYGDSHAKQYALALDQFGNKEHLSMALLTHSACLSLPSLTNIYQGKTHQSCIDMLNTLKSKLATSNATLLLAYRYTKTLATLDGRKKVNFKQEQQYTQMLLTGLQDLLVDLGKDRKVIIVGGVPSANLHRGYLDCISTPFTSRTCHEKFPIEEAEFFSLRNSLKKFALTKPQVLFLDPYDALCDQQYCYVVRDGQLYYSDHAHLSIAGTKLVVDYFSNEILSFIDTDNKLAKID